VEDFDREVLTLTAHQLPRFLGQHQAGPVVRIDDLVADLEVADVLDVFLEDLFHGGLI